MTDPPTVELSHIYHFRGSVGRALLAGQGTSNDGETLYIGAGTDFGYMRGEYVAGNGDIHTSAFAHL